MTVVEITWKVCITELFLNQYFVKNVALWAFFLSPSQ